MGRGDGLPSDPMRAAQQSRFSAIQRGQHSREARRLVLAASRGNHRDKSWCSIEYIEQARQREPNGTMLCYGLEYQARKG